MTPDGRDMITAHSVKKPKQQMGSRPVKETTEERLLILAVGWDTGWSQLRQDAVAGLCLSVKTMRWTPVAELAKIPQQVAPSELCSRSPATCQSHTQASELATAVYLQDKAEVLLFPTGHIPTGDECSFVLSTWTEARSFSLGGGLTSSPDKERRGRSGIVSHQPAR